jgi:RNA polymerase sigma factor (sigma-70 family)
MPAIPQQRSDAEREVLSEKYLPLVKRIVRAWGGVDIAEAESDSCLKLVELINNTPTDKLTEAYVVRSIKNCLKRTSASDEDAPDMISLDEDVSSDDGGELSRYETIPDPNVVNAEAELISREDETASEVLADVVVKLLDKLPVRQHRAVSMVYGLEGFDPRPMVDVAAILHITRMTLHRDLKAANETLCEELTSMGHVPPAGKFDVREVLREAA